LEPQRESSWRIPSKGRNDLCSHRDSLGQNGGTKFFRQWPWRQDVNWNAEQFQQRVPDRADVEHRGLRRGINQDIEVAAFHAASLCDGTENTGIARVVCFHDSANGGAVRLKSV
jgi:hypothetical protein